MEGLQFFTDKDGRLKMDGSGSIAIGDLLKIGNLNLERWLLSKGVCTQANVESTLLKLGLADIKLVDDALSAKKCTKETLTRVGIDQATIEKLLALQK